MIMSNNLSLRNVAIGYHTRRHSSRKVAEGLCATAPASTLTCIIGRNGAGKSTLLRSIAQLQQSLEGKMTLGDKDISDFSREELARRLSIVLTRRPDAENMTVGELVQLGRAPYTGFWGQLSDNDRLAADRALRMVGIEHMKHRRLCSLSDGECQKAMIAKSLAQDTPVILLDEPTAFLDFPGKVELMLLLSRLAHEEGKTILLSTHDLETALQTADRLWLMQEDGIREGSPRQLVDNGAIKGYIGREDVEIGEDFCLRIKKS